MTEEPAPYWTPKQTSEETLINLLFVPGIEHEDGDLEQLQEQLSDVARIITVQKEDMGFEPKFRRNGRAWEEKMDETLEKVIRTHAVYGLLGHSYGAHRATRLLAKHVRVSFAILLNPALNKINEDIIKMKTPPPLLTETQTEKRLWPLIVDFTEEQYKQFISRHAAHELNGEGPVRPWITTEFSNLRDGDPLPVALRSSQPDIPVDIVRSPDDAWDIKEWGDLGMNIHMHSIEQAGHYLHVSQAERIAGIIRAAVERTLQCSPGIMSSEAA